MKLLGKFASNLSSFHYEELLQLLDSLVSKGDFSAGATFNQDAVDNLRQQGQDFTTLPLSSAGQRLTEESLNTPFDLLSARFSALVSEANDYDSRVEGLISILEKDTVLLDQLLAAASVEAYARSKPRLGGSVSFNWDFSMGYGSSSTEITSVDPANNILYNTRPPLLSLFSTASNSSHAGLSVPYKSTDRAVKALSWAYTTSGTPEELYGSDWAKLTLLENNPLINFTSSPQVQVILPTGGLIANVFDIRGQVTSGTLPIYIRTQFTARRNQLDGIVPVNAVSNPGFESGSTGWTLGAGWTVGTSPVHSGTQAAAKASGVGTLTSAPFNVIAGQILGLSAFINSDSLANGSASVQLIFYDRGGAQVLDLLGNPVAVSLPVSSPVTNWLQLSNFLTVPGNTAIATAAVQIAVSGHTTGNWYFDDISVRLPILLSSYAISADDVSIYIPNGQVFFAFVDYIVDDSNQVTLLTIPDGTAVSIHFSELYPSYQCSVNGKSWSPIRMLDPNRPYVDSETNFLPVAVTLDDQGARTCLPITDELGIPTGLTIKLLGRPKSEYQLLVTTPVQGNTFGARATLQVEFERTAYMNVISLSPFTSLSGRLVQIDAQSFGADSRQTIFLGNKLVDRPIDIKFPRILTRTLYLTFAQENYSIKEHTLDAPDKLQRDVLNSLQSVLPFSVRRSPQALPQKFRGYQYEFGLEDIQGKDLALNAPGIFIAGPYRFQGCPEVIRLDADVFNQVSIYLCFKAYDAAGVLQDLNLQGIAMTPGTCIIFPFADGTVRGNVKHCDIFLKVVNRSDESILERVAIQVTGI